MTPILEIRDLRKHYRRVQALRGIDIQLTEPGVYGFLGPNGAGKTTTINLVAGLIKPTSGTVRIGGIDMATDPVRALRGTGVMMESPRFYAYLSGRNNLRVLARLTGLRDESRIDSLLKQVGLSSKADAKVESYSRGMRQRLGLAAALLDDPQLVVLDEPTNGLDPSGIVETRRWLMRMAREEGRTIFLSSHQMGEMEKTCDRVIIINEGQIVASGRTSELSQAKPTVLIRTHDTAEVAAALEGHAGITRVEVLGPQRVRVETPSLSTSEINRMLVDRELDIIGISEERESLEDVFFRLVGRENNVA